VFRLPAIKWFAAIAAPENERDGEEIFSANAQPVCPNIERF